MNTLQEILDYWKNPDEQNDPLKYMDGWNKTEFLIGKIEKFNIPKDIFILELGCNIGRNLDGLFKKGYYKLCGVEINKSAVNYLYRLYQRMGSMSHIANNSIDDYLNNISNDSKNFFYLIFTMAVLCHIHPDIENQIFNNMINASGKYILTIEDEKTKSDRHFPRNYKDIFESRGMIQIENQRCNKIIGLGKNYIYRIFEKK